jgi:hypothetical protein
MSGLSRRTLVAGAATLPALAGSVAAITPDPAFAAVERVQAAWKAIVDVSHEEPDDFRSPLRAAWNAKQDTVCTAHSDAVWDMIQTVPTTKAGAIAMITAHIEQRGDIDEISEMLLESLAEAIPHLA